MADISKGKLRKNYSSFEEFVRYSEIYGLHSRLGYKTAKSAWDRNPTIQWSTNPADFKKVKPMYKIKHLLDENGKITNLDSQKEFIKFVKLIRDENNDTKEFNLNTVKDCRDYINDYCDNLKLL